MGQVIAIDCCSLRKAILHIFTVTLNTVSWFRTLEPHAPPFPNTFNSNPCIEDTICHARPCNTFQSSGKPSVVAVESKGWSGKERRVWKKVILSFKQNLPKAERLA